MENVRKLIFLMGILLVSSLISAEDFGYNYLKGDLDIQTAINYSTINVNNSQYWQGLVPSDLANTYVPYNGATKNVYLNTTKLFIGSGNHALGQQDSLSIAKTSGNNWLSLISGDGILDSAGISFHKGTNTAYISLAEVTNSLMVYTIGKPFMVDTGGSDTLIVSPNGVAVLDNEFRITDTTLLNPHWVNFSTANKQVIIQGNVTADTFFGKWNESFGYVPYTGATNNVDLGNFNLTGDNLFINKRIGVINNNPLGLVHIGNETYNSASYYITESATNRVAGYQWRNDGKPIWYLYKPNDNSNDLVLGNGSSSNVVKFSQGGNVSIDKELHIGDATEYIETITEPYAVPELGNVKWLKGSALGGLTNVFGIKTGIFLQQTSTDALIPQPQITFIKEDFSLTQTITADFDDDSIKFQGGNFTFINFASDVALKLYRHIDDTIFMTPNNAIFTNKVGIGFGTQQSLNQELVVNGSINATGDNFVGDDLIVRDDSWLFGDLNVNQYTNLGTLVSSERINSSLGPRTLNIVDANATIRVWRFTELENYSSQIEFGIGTKDVFFNNSVWGLGVMKRPIGNDYFSIYKRTYELGALGEHHFSINQSGSIGIGTIIPSHKLNVNGSVNITNNLYVEKDLEVLGNATYNGFYGGMFLYNETGIAISMNTSWQKFSAFHDSPYDNGFIFHDSINSKLECLQAGVYQVKWDATGDGAINHIYEGKIYVNTIPQNNTYGRTEGSSTAISTMTGFGFIRLEKHDNVSLYLRDSSGTTSGTVYAGNVNLVRVGN